MAEYIIVGVDPGTTCALAAVDFSGRVVGVYSSRDMGVSQAVSRIISMGRPSVIASDVNPAPEFVSTVASRFGVKLFVPEKTLQVSEKLTLTRGCGTGDAHQRDALAAALYAYCFFSNKLRKINMLGLGGEVAHEELKRHTVRYLHSNGFVYSIISFRILPGGFPCYCFAHYSYLRIGAWLYRPIIAF